MADYCDLTKGANELDINVYKSNAYNLRKKEDINHINNLNIDIAFVIGWQRLIPDEILNTMSIGCFGMHGSSMNLPLGRGRSPMNWSIIENRKHFYTNLFKYDSGVDSGEVLDTFKFNITQRDTAETMHFKNVLAMKYLLEKNLNELLNGNIKLNNQKNVTPTYYPKRKPSDSLIDWGMDVYQIERFIRSVTKPFNGAFSYLDKKVTIYDSQVFDNSEYGYHQREVGEVVVVFPGGKFLIKCNGGLLLINEWETESNTIHVGKIFNNGGRIIKEFKRNRFGFFDL